MVLSFGVWVKTIVGPCSICFFLFYADGKNGIGVKLNLSLFASVSLEDAAERFARLEAAERLKP
jgi:hypothetical protein